MERLSFLLIFIAAIVKAQIEDFADTKSSSNTVKTLIHQRFVLILNPRTVDRISNHRLTRDLSYSSNVQTEEALNNNGRARRDVKVRHSTSKPPTSGTVKGASTKTTTTTIKRTTLPPNKTTKPRTTKRSSKPTKIPKTKRPDKTKRPTVPSTSGHPDKKKRPTFFPSINTTTDTPTNVTGHPSTSEKPNKTKLKTTAVKPTSVPSKTKILTKPTKRPAVTKKSEVTRRPDVTKPTKVTKRPGKTKRPTVTKRPKVTKRPGKSIVPGKSVRERLKGQIGNKLKTHPIFNVSVAEGVEILKQNLKSVDVKNQESIKDYLTNASVVLIKDPQIGDGITNDTKHVDNTEVVKLLEELGQLVSNVLKQTISENDTEIEIQISAYYLVFGVKVVKTVNFTGYSFPDLSKTNNNRTTIRSYNGGADDQQIVLPKDVFDFTSNNESFSSIVSLSYLPATSMEQNARDRGVILGSDSIISTSIYPPITQQLDVNNSVKIILKKSAVSYGYDSLPGCVYWNYTANENNGAWSNEGCEVDTNNGTHVVCSCNHLTDFSMLMGLYEIPLSHRDRLALGLITKIGCSLSIAFLLITILIIVTIRDLRKKQRYFIHWNLSISLVIANLCFLFGETVSDNEDGCLTMSIATFYFYLAAFFWMLCEGIFIWRALVGVFTEDDKNLYYALIGWGFPAVIVLVTSILKFNEMTNKQACWLAIENGVILAFIVPALLIIVINVIILILALRIAKHQSKKMENDNLRSSAKLTLVLLPLLGATWLFGVFAINEETLAFKYIFTVLNSLQGLFIFFCYIVVSKEVRHEICKNRLRASSLSIQSNQTKLSTLPKRWSAITT